MKKITAIIVLTIFIGVGLFSFPKIVENILPKTSVAEIKNVLYTESVIAIGEVQQNNPNTIITDKPLVISKIMVNNGDKIEVGQEVAKVDKTATVKQIIEQSQYSALTNTVGGYEEVLASIPENIISNCSGIIESINIKENILIPAGEIVCTLGKAEELIVNSLISENYISKVSVGQEVIISGNGFADKEYIGIVEEISSIATKQYIGSSQDTVVGVKIRFLNSDESIRPGYSAKVEILTSAEKNIPVVPYEAVMEDEEEKEFVYVFNNGIAVRKDIKTGIELSDGVELLEGLTPNDCVLMSSPALKEGNYVKIQE